MTARLSFEEALAFSEGILSAYGAAPEHARLQATWLLEGELRGHPSHGIQRLPMIVQRMERGLTDGDASPALTAEGDSLLKVDGNRCFGPVAGVRTLEALMARTASGGVCIGLISNANHLGMLAPYVERGAEQGYICLALTTSEALVHPWGGIAPLIGTNPIAIGVPATPAPFVLDMSTAAVSMGRILRHRNTGEPLEAGWAIDGEGHPTTDPAQAGAISPYGGAKGYGLALGLELLVASLTDSALGTDVSGTLDADSVCNKGDVLICFSRTFVGAAVARRIDAYLAEIRSTATTAGAEAVLIPGDRARARREEHRRRQIEIEPGVWSQLQALNNAA